VLKKEVIGMLCDLCTLVAQEKFGDAYSWNCFCERNGYVCGKFFQFDRVIVEFIFEAVREKLYRIEN
jgi:hypothetical protein